MRTHDDSKKSKIKSILATNGKEKARDSKRISWGESKVMQYQKGKNTTIIEEKNETLSPLNYNDYKVFTMGKREKDKDEEMLNTITNDDESRVNKEAQQEFKYVTIENSLETDTNFSGKGIFKDKTLKNNQNLDSKKNDNNVIPIIIEETNKKALKPSRVTLNLNDILNKTEEQSPLEEKDEHKNENKKNNRLTINLKDTLNCLINDDSSDGSIDLNKYDPKNYFNTSSKRLQSNSKISLSPIMMDKEKLILDVCNSSASRKLDYGEKLINNYDIRNNEQDNKMEIINEITDNITDYKKEDKLIIKNKDIEEIKIEVPTKKTAIYKDNFSEILEVDEGNYSKGSEDTPQFPSIIQSEIKDSRNPNRETIDLNQVLQIQNNLIDSVNDSIVTNNCNKNVNYNNQLYTSIRKESKADKVTGIFNNINTNPIPQSHTKLLSPNSINYMKNTNNNNQILSPSKEYIKLDIDSIRQENDVKKRINAYLKIIEDISLQKENKLIENKAQIHLLIENAKDFDAKKQHYLNEKKSFVNNSDHMKSQKKIFKDNIKKINSISKIVGISIHNTENNCLKMRILNCITIHITFKEFSKKLCQDTKYVFEILNTNFTFDKIISDKLNVEVINEVICVYKDLLQLVFEKSISNPSVCLTFPKFIECLKKVVKYSSYIIYLLKCLCLACVSSESLSFICQNGGNILNKKANLKLGFINIQGILVEFKFEIEIFNCFYGIKLTDLSMDNVSHQKMSDQELNNLMNILKEVKNYFATQNNSNLIFKLRDFIDRIPNFLYK